MDAEVYTDPRVVKFIEENFVPVRVHIRQQAEEFKRLGERYGAQWTPTILIIDSSGQERHRIEGFLPADDFLPQPALGLAKSAFARGEFGEAEHRFRQIVDTYPTSDVSPEALYWAGVARYKATNDASALADTAEQFRRRYQQTNWAKKASVWGTAQPSVSR
ncbi:MAG: thioredoxin fold domain-containing protein [Acidimicrobiia bacterium]